ncbi:MAG: hypothetical protein RMI49_04580 [Candidatus Caldarchaeum sp.]|nr:hypothetical protein [Candidatus Caldarchaeum sp.]
MISYGSGAAITVVLTAGVLLVLTGTGAVAFDLLQGIAVLLSVFGGYTIVYAVFSKDRVYHLVWGALSTAVGIGLLTTPLVNPLITLGLLLIILALLGVFAIRRK